MKIEGLADLPYWLALTYAPKVGIVTVHKLLGLVNSLADLFTAPKEELIALGLSPPLITYLQQPNWSAVEQDLAWSEKEGGTLLAWSNPAYPKLLKETVGAPLVLYVKGSVETLNTPQLAIVGSRNPTAAGAEIAYEFAQQLSLNKLTITSGLALGIDACSHKGALISKGQTIAVMGTGLNQIYPQRHQSLATQIVEQGGALVSEFSPQVLPRPENFPRRNRIISGLSLGVLVIEAAMQSGSLITAKYGLEQGREIFAIPGSIYNPLARGCHALLKQGAKLVETSQDILEELGVLFQVNKPNLATIRPRVSVKSLDINQAKLVECVDYEVTPIDVIVGRSGLATDKASFLLMDLELKGHIMSVPGGYARSISCT